MLKTVQNNKNEIFFSVYHLLRGGDTGDSSGRQIMEAERSGLPPNTR